MQSSGSEDGGKEHYIMKKTLMALALSMAVSASCFAAGASSRFATEEKAADAMVAALTSNTVTYEQVSKSFSQEMKKNFPVERLAAVKDEIKNKVGAIKNINFVNYVKRYHPEKGYNGIEELHYVGSIGKDKISRISVLFILENNAPKIIDVQVSNPIELKTPEAAPAKK